jgi:MFS family permease
VLRLTNNSVAALGVVSFVTSLPTLLLMLTGGVVADRWDRRRIMIVTQAMLMTFALEMAALLATDRLNFGLLLAISVFIGVATAYDLPAQQALVPDLVEANEIPQAIALNQVIFNGSRLVGPAIAGLALATMNVATVYALNGLSFIAVIASLAMLRIPAGRARGGAGGSMLDSLREGLRYVNRSSMLRALFGVAALTVLFIFPSMAVLSAGYARRVLHGGGGTIAALMAVSGGASMLGAFAMMWIPAERRGAVMVGGVIVQSVMLLAYAALPHLAVAVVATGFMSLGFSLFFGLNATTVQQTVPTELRGRVMSVSGLMFNGVLPFTGLGMSLAVDRLGFAPVYAVSAVLYAITALTLLLPSGILGFVPPAMPHPAEPAREPVAVGAD